MSLRQLLAISLLWVISYGEAQSVSSVYKIDDLLARIKNKDTVYVVNFWATWCKPCVQELPAFDSLYVQTKNLKIKILLVSIDFKEELNKKVNPFLKNKKVLSECVLLDEVNGNDFINKISTQWSGAIPGTFLKKGDKTKFLEKKLNLSELKKELEELGP